MTTASDTGVHPSPRVFRFGHPGIWFGVAAGLSLVTSLLSRMFSMPWGARFALALLPIPAIVVLALSIRSLSAGLDELERRVQLEALAMAFAVAAVAFIAFNQFRIADMLGPEDWFIPWLAIWGGYSCGLVAARRRYR
jgi:hypothetical protein